MKFKNACLLAALTASVIACGHDSRPKRPTFPQKTEPKLENELKAADDIAAKPESPADAPAIQNTDLKAEIVEVKKIEGEIAPGTAEAPVAPETAAPVTAEPAPVSAVELIDGTCEMDASGEGSLGEVMQSAPNGQKATAVQEFEDSECKVPVAATQAPVAAASN